MNRATVRIISILGGLAVCTANVAHAEEEVASVVVPSFRGQGIEPEVVRILGELLLDALLNRHGIQALGPSDLKDMLTLEQQKQLMGCGQDSCMADIAGGLGARYLISGQVGKLGSLTILNLKLIDTETSKATARSSLKMKSIEEAVDAIGPLTDKLLKRSTRLANANAIAAFKTPDWKASRKLMDKRTFCKKAEKYLERLKSPPYDPQFVKQRHELVEDMVLTPFARHFEEKFSCFARGNMWYTDGLRSAIKSSTTKNEADDARLRMQEWFEMFANLALAKDEYDLGLEKVKLGTGTLPEKLTFPIKAAQVPVPDDSDEVKKYRETYPKASKVVVRAFKVLEKKQLEKFKKLFAPKTKKWSRSGEEYIFKTKSSRYENGRTMDVCPWWLLDADQIEDNAKTLAKEGILVGCVRSTKKEDGSASVESIKLRKFEGKWLIQRW